MKTLYLDCFAGVSGDMFLGALLDLGVSLKDLSSILEGLGIPNYQLNAEKSQKNGITGTKFSVLVTDKDRHHRHMPDIEEILEKSDLSKHIKEKSLNVFKNLAVAEAKIHGIPPEKVHFHEVGAIDSIIDIIGTITALDLLGVKKITSSPLPLGSGFVNCAHGIIPLPAPAALELLTGIPTKSCAIEGETVTPTGAALIKTLCEDFGPMPPMRILSTGYGAGQADRKIPNLLRAILGEAESETGHSGFLNDSVIVIEANIDDMNPEFYEYIFPLLFSSGAVDVYLTNVIMKKGRPGQVLTCLAPENKVKALVQILLNETTTLGVRTFECQRHKLVRETVMVETQYGRVAVKLGRHPDTLELLNAAPEWEDCKEKAVNSGVPVKIIYDSAKAAIFSDSGK